MYSVRDSLRPLIAWGYRKLQSASRLKPNLSLEDLYLAVLLASRKLNVRLRPETKGHENILAAESIVGAAIAAGETDHDAGLLGLCLDIRNERPPEALLEQILTTVRDRFLGFEALALASIAERSKHTVALHQLPPIPGLPDTPDAKAELARAWLRCWQRHGFWLSAMPGEWWRGPRSHHATVRGQRGRFRTMDTVLAERAARDIFWKQWSPVLLGLFTDDMESGYKRLRGSELTLLLDGQWTHCSICKSVHRPCPASPIASTAAVPTSGVSTRTSIPSTLPARASTASPLSRPLRRPRASRSRSSPPNTPRNSTLPRTRTSSPRPKRTNSSFRMSP